MSIPQAPLDLALFDSRVAPRLHHLLDYLRKPDSESLLLAGVPSLEGVIQQFISGQSGVDEPFLAVDAYVAGVQERVSSRRWRDTLLHHGGFLHGHLDVEGSRRQYLCDGRSCLNVHHLSLVDRFRCIAKQMRVDILVSAHCGI